MSTPEPPYVIRFAADAKKDVESLAGSVPKQLRKSLEKKLAFHPAQHCEPLVGILKGYWSHHFAAHRVIFRLYHDLKLVLVCAVGSRRAGHATKVYRQFEALVEAGRTAQQILDALRGLPRRKP